MTLWQVDIYPADGQPDSLGASAAKAACELGISNDLIVHGAYGFLIQGSVDLAAVQHVARDLLSDPIAQRCIAAPISDNCLSTPPTSNRQATLVYALPKPGVMDPVAQSTLKLLRDIGLDVDEVRTFRKYWIGTRSGSVEPSIVDRMCQKVLANDSIEQVNVGPLRLTELAVGSVYSFQKVIVPISNLDDAALMKLSKDGQLYFTLPEFKTIQTHFATLGREPTDIELETIAQTWSEHCSHKTLGGKIEYTDENGTRQFQSMLKETIFAATVQIRKELGDQDWCVSVFKDNAGVVTFDDDDCVVFKVETHNHPSAIEPYGGANTGLGGVIRDPLGTGLGAKPVCSTDVFCFANPDYDPAKLPPGVLHPRRVMSGVVSGVRDYGNRMGIPTVNGAVYFDDRYLGNPLVYCGNVGIIPRNKVEKHALPGDRIVAIGGRTGRDGIHGATFSSVELTEESESISGGAVQIGNAITEKMVLDVLLAARDEGLYSAVTDCGAGGFSSAVGEMGEDIGAEVWLEQAPLKYEGLSYTEIWISEAQERMILAVPPEKIDRLKALCASEGVEAAVLGVYTPTGNLRLMYRGEEVGCLSMEFLHGGRPPIVRQAVYQPSATIPLSLPNLSREAIESTLLDILSHPTVASKHWIIRQYDHEVQAGSVVKPLVGPSCNGPSDAAVVKPKLNSSKGIVLACGMNPTLGDFDPYHMATSAMDEAVRNAVAVGADPSKLAVLDNFCWGNTEKPETLGTLVRAAIACHDLAVQWKTPFISGKDSLNNEFSFTDDSGAKKTIAIPCSLLISAMGQIENCQQAITMDLKKVGNAIYLVGVTREELAGSQVARSLGLKGGKVPEVDAPLAMRLYEGIHRAIRNKQIVSCHDLSEGGLAVSLAEMAFAGELGVSTDLTAMRQACFVSAETALFSESNSRLLCEVPADCTEAFESAFEGLPVYRLGTVEPHDRVTLSSDGKTLIDVPWKQLRDRWLAPLDWQ
ncbi:phosphoribosylformylglycinamidine synthase subunit PurL [Pirellulaceae bacterium SH467]